MTNTNATGTLALRYLSGLVADANAEWPVHRNAKPFDFAIADLRALMAERDAKDAALVSARALVADLGAERERWRDTANEQLRQRIEVENERSAALAERDRLRATLDEIAGHLRGRCEPGTTAMHCYNVATRALANREGVKP